MDRKTLIVSREDWSLHRKGYMDQLRHIEKVKAAIKNNLADMVSEESIIYAEGKKVIKVPIRSLEEYRFRFNVNKQKHVGHGTAGSKPGDVIGKEQLGNPQGAGGAGEQPGMDYYESEITLDELADMVFEELCLPNLQEKRKKLVEKDTFRFNDIRSYGLMGNLDKKKTILVNYKRNALRGNPGIHGIKPEDLRFRTWIQEPRWETSAVVLAMMDTSGSMGTFEKYIARSFFFWMTKFLRSKYKEVDIVFLAHHTRAKEVSEEEFFTKGESGGTKCSSVYQLALKLIQERFPPEDFNLYPFHFTDGDNLPSDNELCVQLVEKLADVSSLFGYGEIINPYYRSSTLMTSLKKVKNPKLVTITIKDKMEVFEALKTFFFCPDNKKID
ncbi:MAG: sporulation protein YhbH [Bacillota bacterium]